MKKLYLNTAMAALFLLCADSSLAQRDYGHNTSYYVSFPHHVTARLFLSQKYSTLYFRNKDAMDIQYKGNNKLHVGAGFSSDKLSLAAGVGVAYLHNKDKGKTKSYDLMLRFFPRDWMIEGTGFYSKGYHLNREDAFPLHSKAFYYRPDLHLSFAGVNVFRLMRADRFSFRAAIGQSEWQKRSAGTFLYGANISYGWMKGDSALVPAQFESNYRQAGIRRIAFFHVGPGAGYAYTWVAGQHFFITGFLSGHLDLNVTGEEKVSNTRTKVSVLPAAIYRGSVGYNSSTWGLAADLSGSAQLIKGNLKNGGYILPMGIYRLVVSRKFSAKKG